MKRVFDMNYDRWVETCGSDSYKPKCFYVNLRLDENKSSSFYPESANRYLDKLAENPIKCLSG